MWNRALVQQEYQRRKRCSEGRVNYVSNMPITASENQNTSDPESTSSSSSTMSAEEALSMMDDEIHSLTEISTTTSTDSSITSTDSLDDSTGSADSNEVKTKSNKPRVKFGDIEIRRYNRTLGDNPACQDGPPITLDWSYSKEMTQTSIDEYEANRFPRRTRRQLVMTTTTRRNMMAFHFGYSMNDINLASKSILKTKKQRKETKKLTPAVERRQEMKENITRKVKRTLSREKLLNTYTKNYINAYESDSLNRLEKGCLIVAR
jgi:hypothetical protein